MKRVLWVLWSVAVAALFFCAGAASAMTAPEFYALASLRPEVNAYAATCQSAVETGRWTSELWQTAQNGAGIKAGAAWRKSGRYVVHRSPESVCGAYVMRDSYFRAYRGPEEFLADYAAKIKRDYPLCFARRENFFLYFAGLYRGRLGAWATDHRYFEKLVRMSVALAPDIFGADWQKKLLLAAHYAGPKLLPWQRDVLAKILRR